MPRLPAAALLLGLVALQAWLVAAFPRPVPIGDEGYYLGKARQLRERGEFPRADARALAIERGEVWGTADYRPPGYPALLALFGQRLAIWVQFAGIAALLFAIFFIATDEGAHPLACALLLGLAPWPFEYTASWLADPFNAIFAFAGLLLLARGRTFPGALLLSATLLLRADMIVLPPIIFACAWWLRRRSLVAMASAFLIVVALQYAYRVHFTGRAVTTLYAPFRISYGEALKWAGTWIGTERETTDFVWTLGRSEAPPPLPARSWADEEEKRTLDAVRRARVYTAETDAVFARLREKRLREHFFSAGVLPRVWIAAHLWVNLETSPQLVHALSPLPRTMRRTLVAALLLLKAAIFMLALRARKTPLVILCLVFVLARTVEIGALAAGEHRYALAAWLPLLLCAASGVRQRQLPLSNGERELAAPAIHSGS